MTELGTAGISMALGQIEEAMGLIMGLIDGRLIDGRRVRRAGYTDDDYTLDAYKALVRARDLLRLAMQAQQVAVFEAPIREEEIRS